MPKTRSTSQASMSKPPTSPADYGPDERHQHGTVRPELTGRGHAVRMRARDNCELDRLLWADAITQDEWSAGDALARKLHAARMMGMSVSKPERVSSGDYVSQRQANALLDVTDALRWLDMSCGDQVRSLVLAVCLSERKCEAQHDLVMLRFGLATLIALTPERRLRMAVLDDLLTQPT